MTKPALSYDDVVRQTKTNSALMKAVAANDAENAKTLAKQLPAQMVGGGILVSAVRMERMDMVATLLPFADATVHNSLALQWASALNNVALVELLYPVSDPQAALLALQGSGWDGNGLAPWTALEEHLAVVQKGVLEQATARQGKPGAGRKM